ncbi:MAG: hypothetical protein DRH17_06605 [Deltaproteobacteria bacterium]|nr:MAG: hypothetical protein DRH17_06605 [Deltaproteobacteria bacterium]
MEYKIQKFTGTYADTLEAVGTADLLGELTGVPVRIEDIGDAFRISVVGETAPMDWKPPGPGYPFIFLRNKDGKRPQGRVIDYDEERKKDEAARLYRRPNGKKKAELEQVLREQGLPEPEQPTREYRMASILASMRMGWDADKKLYRWIVEHPEKALEWARARLTSGDEFVPPVRLSNSQFFSPATGKGVHAAKTVAKSPGAISKEVVDPFSEWMKYRGAYSAMLPYRVGKDIKVYVIEPGDIDVEALRALRHTLMDLNLWGGIRLDIESSLRLAEQLILKSDVMGRQIGLRRRRPNEIVKGLRQAFFKNLGTASALMNDAFMPLPGWFVISDRGAANAFLGIIEEHIGTQKGAERTAGSLGSLAESRSGDVPVLQQYRKWLTTGELSDFLEFTARFAVHIMQRRGVKELSIVNIKELLVRGYPMKAEEIITNDGFLSVARAIRNSTIYALSLKKREVRFGLAQDWKQKMKGGSKSFLPLLADFVQQYNWETEHRLKGKGHTVKSHELDKVFGLIDEHGAELVGMLLLAYGFARPPKTDPGTEAADDESSGVA